jgi:hypothetical protein
MHRDRMTPEYLRMIHRGMSSKAFVDGLHDQGFTRDDSVELVKRVFGVSRGAAELFVVSHPAWAADPFYQET